MTSFMHSLNPALYLLRTVASAESAAGREREDAILVTYKQLCDSFRKSWLYDPLLLLYQLTAHLYALQVPQVLHCHLQDVCFFQLGVSGALWKGIGKVKFIFMSYLKPTHYLRIRIIQIFHYKKVSRIILNLHLF